VRICPRCSSVYAAHVARCGLDNELLVEGPQDPLVGKTLDRYLIVERLGAGGMGCVYRATHTIIDREYAIKVLYGDFACDDKFRARFQREAQSVSKIRHPNVVTVEDFGTTSTGLTFLAMEMVRGRTLEEVIEKEAPISPARTAHIVRQVASGLGAAHQLGFVHRDVKPANVMLTRVDGVEWVKILDFGAVNLRAVPLDQRLTSIGHIIGTPTYMAPEQTQDPNVEATADLYAMGVMMHEMLTGQPPFTGQGRAEVLVKHITEAPPPTPPSRGSGGVDPEVVAQIARGPTSIGRRRDRRDRSAELGPGAGAGAGGQGRKTSPGAATFGVERRDPTGRERYAAATRRHPSRAMKTSPGSTPSRA
jgi:serine/threonine protein kinase